MKMKVYTFVQQPIERYIEEYLIDSKGEIIKLGYYNHNGYAKIIDIERI